MTEPADHVTNELGRVARRRRESLGLGQAEVAELAGCSQRFVHSLEAGKATVRLDKALAVLRVLGLDLVVAPGEGTIRAEDSPR